MSPAERASDPAVAVAGELPAATAAVLAVYDGHQRELHSFLLAMTREPEAAEDLLHEAFVRLIDEVRRGRGPQNPRAWLYRVCANLAISRGRHRRSADRWRARAGPMESAASAEQAYLRHEDEGRLVDALATLPSDARAGLLMSAHGFRGEEIARLLGRTPLATRSLLFRARARMRDQLQAGEERP